MKRCKKVTDADGTGKDEEASPGAEGARQTTLRQSLESACYRKMAHDAFDRAVTFLVATDIMPTATVKRAGFGNFCKKLAPKLPIPSQRTVMCHITEVFDEKKGEIAEVILNARWVPSTADL